MRLSLMPRTAVLAVVFALVFALGACGGADASTDFGGGSAWASAPEQDDTYTRTPPPVAMPSFGGVEEYWNDDGTRNVVADLTNTADGYVAVRLNAPGVAQAYFRVQKDDYLYNYFLDTNGEDQYYPLAMGDGNYTFSVFLNVVDDQYEQFLTAGKYVELNSEFAPFLVPSEIVDYTPDSAAVQESYTIAEHAKDNLEVVQQVYWWISQNITYDTAKAETLQAGPTVYLPDVDETLQTKKGICYDYAALAAAMLRANAIPCKLIMGQVDTGEGQMLQHAWNMFWLEEEGWITVKLPSTPDEWERIDLTFAASGNQGIEAFIGDGSHYADVYYH